MSETDKPAFEVQMHSDMGRTQHPAFNIKVRQGPESVTLPIELGSVADTVDGPMRKIFTDPEFTLDWIEENVGPGDKNGIWENVCEANYDYAKQQLEELFSLDVSISTEGRSGGWMVIDGLPEDISEWDDELRRQWVEAGEIVKACVEDVPRAYLVSIYSDSFEGRTTPAPMDAPKVEVVVDRDPDAGTNVTVFIDGEEVQAVSYTVDPGYGHTHSDWLHSRDEQAATASPKVAELVRATYDHYTNHAEFIAEG